MSSTSSVCSSNEAEFIIDTRIPTSIRRDIDRFSVFINRLRSTLETNSAIVDGEQMCVNVHAALEMVSESMRDLFKYPQFKTNPIILPSLQLVQAVKDLKFDTCTVDTTPVLNIIDQLESAVLNIILNRHIVSSNHHTPTRSSTLGRWKQNNSLESYPRHPTTNGLLSLQRRHSTHQTASTVVSDGSFEQSSNNRLMEIDRLLIARADGVEIAFERTKAWSLYCKEVIAFVRARIQLEQDHARKVQVLVEASRRDISKSFMPLREIFENSFDIEVEMLSHTKEATEHIRDRVVEALDARRKEHDACRNSMKVEWNKALKHLHDCEELYDKAKVSLRLREEALKKSRESCLRTESSPPEREASRRRRELDKKSRAVDEAAIKKEEAERHVMAITTELRKKRREVEKTKEDVIEKLRELIFQCEQTTKACTVHYYTSLSALWARLPGAFHELSNATRDYQPGTEYMAFLQTLPTRAASSTSLVRSDRSIDEGVASSCDGSSSLTSLRRNAINPDDEGALPDTKRHKKTSYAGRTFDANEISEAAQSHHIQRTVQPSKCSACETLSILYTVQCIDCGGQWHKACFPRITTMCGQTAKSVDRRTSIFGVPLKGLLEQQKRHLPLILEKSIDQLQRRGLRAKGIYRTCGVKSKIEEICNAFERCHSDEEVDLSSENPMNLASVVKLYLRKLPEPLLTYEMYDDYVRIGTEACSSSSTVSWESHVEELKSLMMRRLPIHNYETVKFVMVHLNRVSWFEEANLMSASNLSTVIAPSLIWMSPKSPDYASAITHTQYLNKTIELMIRHAYTIFGLDRQSDWQSFFSRYSVEEPPKDEEEDGGNESDIEEDIEDLDENLVDDDDEDEEIFLPPTPDILKSSRKPVEQTSSLPSNVKVDVTRRKSGENGTIVSSGDKRKSYTTSIVISPNDMSNERLDKIEVIEKDVFDKKPIDGSHTAKKMNQPILQDLFAEGSMGRTMLLFSERMCRPSATETAKPRDAPAAVLEKRRTRARYRRGYQQYRRKWTYVRAADDDDDEHSSNSSDDGHV